MKRRLCQLNCLSKVNLIECIDMRSIRDIPNLKDKNVLLRADFDIPISDKGQIEEVFRVKKQKETLDYLVEHGAHVVMIAHISDESVGRSFASLVPQFHILLGHEIVFIKTIEEMGDHLENYSGPALLDNIRQNTGEENNDEEFSKQLAQGFDYYINNAFAVCHRNHASVSGVAKQLPSYAGFLVQSEVSNLGKAMDIAGKGKILIMGGAKASTKIPVIKNFLDKADSILLGGVIANDIMKARGENVDDSVVDNNASELLTGLDLRSPKLVMPEDYKKHDNKFLDIGAKTISNFTEKIKNSNMIIWNGPMGMFEDDRFEEGTRAVAEAIIESDAIKIIGGGDTISALDRFGMLARFESLVGSGKVFISTGGGAMLAFLAGEEMPGLKVLGFYE